MPTPRPAEPPESPPGPSAARSIRELVDVAERPTVVRLADLEGETSGWITSGFHLTGEVSAHLDSLRRVLHGPHGTGLFLIGPYGTGKSHFLAYLAAALRGGTLVPGGPEPVPVSLLDFRSDTPLEEIVRNALALPPGPGDRREVFGDLAARSPRGTLLLLDELSEFLRAKPDARRFTEDVRFLQFLGEWGQGERFFTLAAMQEQIERTGELESDLYRKIKDRYPIRYQLTAAHLKDLVSDGLLVKRPGYAAAVEALARDLLSEVPGTEPLRARLAAVYPLHPVTLDLLDEVRDRFSQARGAVDFLVKQLRGDPARGTPAFLDRPWGSLVTPDAVVDHFRDLFEIQPELLPLSQRVFPYYEAHIPELFPAPAQAELAGRLVKLLALVHLSPVREALRAEDAAAWLLPRVSRLIPGKSVETVERVLGTLHQRGRFVAIAGPGYRLDLAEDGVALLQAQLGREVAELAELGDGPFEAAAGLLTDEASPLSLPRGVWQHRTTRWHFHERPYAVCVGNDPPPAPDGLALWIRVPWGQPREEALVLDGRVSRSRVFVLRPERLQRTDELLELAALARLQQRPWPGPAALRLKARLAERLALFTAQVRNAYAGAVLLGPDGSEEPGGRRGAPGLTALLDGLLERMLRRAYPLFERLAPQYGPLPKEALRAFWRFAQTSDLTAEEADDAVRLVSEAYLVPMGLLKRRQREYTVPKDLDRNEAIRLIAPLFESRPEPSVLYEHLGGPPYGLVPDQVSVLLLFLMASGDIDLVKGKRSYRELFETLPNPIQYEAVVPGHALSATETVELERLCEALGIKPPSQWTIHAERRAVRQVREAGRERTSRLRALLLKLAPHADAEGLARRITSLLAPWDTLARHEDELQALQLFLHEAGSVAHHLARLSELAALPDRLERLVSERDRFRHLLSHPGLAGYPDASLAMNLETLGAPPGLADVEELSGWLERARAAYAGYKADYARRHERFWEDVRKDPLLAWQPPRLAESRHLSLGDELDAARASSRRLHSQLCRGLGNLDYTAACGCGFDGRGAAIAEEVARLDALRRRIEGAVARFFGDEAVRSRLRSFVREGAEVSPGTLAYLAGEAPAPEVADLGLLDRHLAGVPTVKRLDVEDVVSLVLSRTWEAPALVTALDELLSRKGGGARLRFETGGPEAGREVARWCLEQSLRNGVALPPGLSSRAVRDAVEDLRAEWIGPAALRELPRLGLPEEAVLRVVRWVIEDEVRVHPRVRESVAPPVAAALALVSPSGEPSARELAARAELLYAEAPTLVRASRELALEGLRALAEGRVPDGVGELEALLDAHPDAGCLVIDAFGLPLLGTVRGALAELFPGWRLAAEDVALTGPETTTASFYARLAERGINRPLEKVNAVDTLLHERRVPFADLCRLALAELRMALRPALSRLDRTRELLVFGDHGFRLTADASGYVHGGPSRLERLVPVLRLSAA